MTSRRRRVRKRSRNTWLYGSVLAFPVAAASLWYVLGERTSSPANAVDTDQVATGEVFYAQYCARCHGQDLKGEFGWMEQEEDLSNDDIEVVEEVVEEVFDDVAPAHDASGQTWRHADETLFQIIKWGPELALGRKSSRMPGSGDQMADEEIWAVIAFLKSHWPAEVQEKQPENKVVQKQ